MPVSSNFSGFVKSAIHIKTYTVYVDSNDLIEKYIDTFCTTCVAFLELYQNKQHMK